MKKTILLLILKGTLLFAQAPAIQWQKCYGGTLAEQMRSIKQTADGGYIIVGSSSSTDGDVTSVNHGGGDVWVVKTSSTGVIEWQKCYGGTKQDTGICVDFTSDGGYLVGAYTYSNDGDVTGNHSANYTDILLLKLSSMGTLQWMKTYGGTANEYIFSIKSTPDGGSILVGNTYSNNDGDVNGSHFSLGTNDAWVLKLSSNGAIQWGKCFGGTSTDSIREILLTSDGGYIFAANTASTNGDVTSVFNGYIDYWVVKINSTGTIQWQKCYGGTAEENITSINSTTDGGYILGGNSNSNNGNVTGNYGSFDYWIVKINATGTIQWQKNFGGSSSDSASGGVQQTTDGGYIIGGYTDSTNGNVTGANGSTDFWFVKLNALGNLSWQKALGGTAIDISYSSQKTTDGGYIITGFTASNNGNVTGNHGSSDAWVVKLATDNLSTHDFLEKSILTLFPNPAKDNISLQLDHFIPSQEITITDILGKTIYNQKLIGLTTTINISNLKQGVYFLSLTYGTQKTTQKFIKE